MNHSLPISHKTKEIVNIGYSEGDFGENYWMHKDVRGNRRIDRNGDSQAQLVKLLVKSKTLHEKPYIVDVGAGPGSIVKAFRKAGFKAEGCEFSESGRRLAKEKFKIDLLPCDLRVSLPYPNGTFDFAACVGVLTMIPVSKLPIAFSELRRILKPGGVFFPLLRNPRLVDNEPHLTCLRMEEWEALVIKAGFERLKSPATPQTVGIGVDNEFCRLFKAI